MIITPQASTSQFIRCSAYSTCRIRRQGRRDDADRANVDRARVPRVAQAGRPDLCFDEKNTELFYLGCVPKIIEIASVVVVLLLGYVVVVPGVRVNPGRHFPTSPGVRAKNIINRISSSIITRISSSSGILG